MTQYIVKARYTDHQNRSHHITEEVEAEEEQSIMEDLELERPVLSQNNQLPGSLPVPGQDVNPQTVKALFPFDTTLAAAADRRNRG